MGHPMRRGDGLSQTNTDTRVHRALGNPKNFTQIKLISTSWGEAIIPFNQVMFMSLTTP